MHWANAIAQRVGTYGNGAWLDALGQWLEVSGAPWLPESSTDGQVSVAAPKRAVQLMFHALPTYDTAPTRSRAHHVVLAEALFDAEEIARRAQWAALPFELDALNETPESATAKLASTDISRGRGRDAVRMSWFLDDQRVVELHFLDGHKGLRRVHIARLWKPVQFGT